MRTRRIDSDNDWSFGAGRQSYATQSEVVQQKIKTRLQMFLSDWFLNQSNGINWISEMSSRNMTDKILNDAKNCILKTQGVKTLDSFSYDRDPKTRKLKITASYTDIYGNSSEVTI